MKARIKATGEIVDLAPYTRVCEDFAKGRSWLVEELDDADDYPDYWTRLKYQTAIEALGNLILTNNVRNGDLEGMKECITNAMAIGHALVQKMKEERK